MNRVLLYFFFFSSRRRHTRLQGDWSSDVCSSDLQPNLAGKNLRRELFGFHPGGCVARTAKVAIASERELATRMAGTFIDHRADGITKIARVHAVKHHFGHSLLTGTAFAARLIVK